MLIIDTNVNLVAVGLNSIEVYMIRVTIEVDGIKATIENEDGITLDETLECVSGAIKGCGFNPKGELEFTDYQV